METRAISVISPVYNEVDNLRPLMAALRDALDDQPLSYEVILVDDGSTDGSRELLRELAVEHPMLRVVLFRRNFGQTAAMGAGFNTARGEVVVPLDADLQNDPADIPMLVEKLDEGWDIVSGWREGRRDGFLRVLLSRVANRLTNRLGGVPLHDTGCTLKAYRRNIVRDMRLYGEMHRFLPLHGSLVGARITEMPVRHYKRRAGLSKYGFNRVLKIVPDLMWVAYLRTFATKPMQLFGGLSLASIALAVCAVTGAVISSVWGANSTASWLLAALVLVLAGTLLMLLGFQMEAVMRTHYESQSRRPYTISEEFGSGEFTVPGRESGA